MLSLWHSRTSISEQESQGKNIEHKEYRYCMRYCIWYCIRYRIRYRIWYRLQYRIQYLYSSCSSSMFLPWDSCSEIDVLECQRDSISPLAFHEIGHTPTGCSRTSGDGCEGRLQDCQLWWNSTWLRSTRGLVWEGYPIDHKGSTQSIQPAW